MARVEAYKNKWRGFTLIEVLLYTFLFALLIGAMVVFITSMLGVAQQSDAQVEAVENSRFLTQKLTWMLRNATSINLPLKDQSGSTLSLNTASIAFNPYIFELYNGRVRLDTAVDDPIFITNSLVRVTNLTFYNYSFSQNSKNTIRVTADIESTNPFRPSSTSIDMFISVQ